MLSKKVLFVFVAFMVLTGCSNSEKDLWKVVKYTESQRGQR